MNNCKSVMLLVGQYAELYSAEVELKFYVKMA